MQEKPFFLLKFHHAARCLNAGAWFEITTTNCSLLDQFLVKNAGNTQPEMETLTPCCYIVSDAVIYLGYYFHIEWKLTEIFIAFANYY